MTTANDLYYNTPVESETKELGILKGYYYDHISEAGIDNDERSFYGHDVVNTRVNIKILKEFDFDGRRFWRLATVWFDDLPVMVIQNAGREGDDSHARFVTSKDGFNGMIEYIREITTMSPDEDSVDVVSPDLDMGDKLTAFYGNTLNGHFERY